MADIDLTTMSVADLEALAFRVGDERSSRMCPEFLQGGPSCDRGREPHTEHGYSHYDVQGRRIRVTWTLEAGA